MIDFDAESPVERLKVMTDGLGLSRVIDALGVDAYRPQSGPASAGSRAMKRPFKEGQQQSQLEGSGATCGGQWVKADAPSEAAHAPFSAASAR
jgi:hypothetical protein